MALMTTLPRTRRTGVAIAMVTACVSGVSVFVNGYGVRRWSDATAYTTAKNLVAALLLGLALSLTMATRPPAPPSAHAGRRARIGMVTIALIGGSIPFVLFFEGLARASSTDAAFLQKTLVVWVALLAVPFLRERIDVPHVAAIALLVVGQAVLTGGVPDVRSGTGEAMILAATLLWAVETVVAKRLFTWLAPLTLAVARMGGGVAVLLVWLAWRGHLGRLFDAGAGAWGWAMLTGVLLAAYVATWYQALALAQAVDVTAVLVIGALVTALLDTDVRGRPAPSPIGLLLVAVGGALAIGAALTRQRATASSAS